MQDGWGPSVPDSVAENDASGIAEVVRLFSGKLRDAIEALPESMRTACEEELQRFARPTANDWALRRSLHAKVQAALAAEELLITTTSVYEGVISKQSFFSHVIPDPRKVAFISRPIVEHTSYYEQIHQVGLRKLVAFIEHTEVTDKNFALFMKFTERAGDRIHGAVAQKMQIQSKNLNVDVSARDLSPSSHGAEDIQLRINQLQGKLLDSGVKDVTPDEEPS